MSKKRAIALVAAAAAIFPFVVASPSHANVAPSTCRTLIAGPTPAVEVDTNNDGNPEVRVPSMTNVRVCVYGDVTLTDSPNTWSEPCNSQGTCQRFFVHYGLSGSAGGSATLCQTIDGRQTCGYTTPVHVPLNVLAPNTMCIGVDLTGGYPCGGGTAMISFS